MAVNTFKRHFTRRLTSKQFTAHILLDANNGIKYYQKEALRPKNVFEICKRFFAKDFKLRDT